MTAAPLRVLIVNVPNMLSEILASEIGSYGGIEVSIAIEQSIWLPSIVRFRPDVVIAGCSDAMTFSSALPLQLYLIGPDENSAQRIELHSVSEEMGDASPSQLAASIKAIRAGREH